MTSTAFLDLLGRLANELKIWKEMTPGAQLGTPSDPSRTLFGEAYRCRFQLILVIRINL